WDAENKRITFDQGKYVFEIGASSKDIKGTVDADMSGTYKVVLSTVIADCDKVVLKPGNTAQMRVSASMSDDSFYDIKKAEVTYKSNNAAVATVDANGRVTAIGPGTASLFAEVTVDGKTLSNNVPVKVMPDLSPKSIKVNGKDISGFNKNTKAYSFLLKSSAKLPVITASAMSSIIAVEIEQAKGLPGTAIVKFVDNATSDINTYYLNFDVKSVSDEFDGPVGKQWQWIRENQSNYSFSKKPGSLTITTETGDISENSNNAKNLLLQSANSDWIAETKLVFSRVPSQPENAGIVAYQDENNFVKLMLRAVTKTSRSGWNTSGAQNFGTIDLVVEENGIAKSVASFNLRDEITGNKMLILKLEKKGDAYTGYYSVNGGAIEKLGVASGLLKDIKAGLIACDGVIIQSMKNTYWFDPDTTKPDTPFDVTFDYFRIVND
ncbi:MAG: Ig-like domain-containing protein, partial [Bacteroidales bacterium]